MLYLNLKRLLELRGIERPYTFLVKNGFASQTAANLINNQIGRITPEQMEKLCLLLNCTPNDLFDWQPDKKTVVPDGHALRSLTKEQTPAFSRMVKDLPVEKLSQLGTIINQLKDDE